MFDFSGTGPEVKGNCNAPRAVTLSALIYCLRCMVGHNVPLNQVHMCYMLKQFTHPVAILHKIHAYIHTYH